MFLSTRLSAQCQCTPDWDNSVTTSWVCISNLSWTSQKYWKMKRPLHHKRYNILGITFWGDVPTNYLPGKDLLEMMRLKLCSFLFDLEQLQFPKLGRASVNEVWCSVNMPWKCCRNIVLFTVQPTLDIDDQYVDQWRATIWKATQHLMYPAQSYPPKNLRCWE